ncbi:phosphatase PAP2 family protein [Tsuneonella sp. CC-YZS046]|uniref:phosphatase PAP2 family protein n=1 Tax=Tsuneonella sp. CC-YZS046 TaxID=3042152 RepID=UPI002D7791EA|nr:phosphatase PAP2 family protein [Tsuneonella sp. CC-YZS046]WRO67888.1 phosphatase PAP2 family protein [Tsuneonella sp. CC-YZS046]
MQPDAQISLRRDKDWRIDPVWAYAIAAACWSGFAIMAWLVAHAQTGSLDEAGLLLWRIEATLTPAGPGSLTGLMQGITILGGVPARSLAAVLAILALVRLNRRREATLLGIMVVAGWIVNSGMKWIFGRARPDIVPHLTEAGGFSFPSGHSFNSAVVYFGIALAFAAISKSAAMRGAMMASAALLSLAIAWSRVWLGVHFPSDIIAGWLAGTGWIFLAHALLDRRASIKP